MTVDEFYKIIIVESMMHTLVDMSRKEIEEKEKRKDAFFGEQYYTKPTEIDTEHTRYDLPISGVEIDEKNVARRSKITWCF